MSARLLSLFVVLHNALCGLVDSNLSAVPPRQPIEARAHQWSPESVRSVTVFPYCFANASTVVYSGTFPGDFGHWQNCMDVAGVYAFYRITVPAILPTGNKTYAVSYTGLCLDDTPNCHNATIVLEQIAWLQNACANTHKYNISEMCSALDTLIEAQIREKSFFFPGMIGVSNDVIIPTDMMNPYPTTGAAKAVYVVFFILVALAVIGTVLEYYKTNMTGGNAGVQGSAEETGSLIEDKPRKRGFTDSLSFRLLAAFSLFHNFRRLLQPVPGATACLNGVRVISILWVMLGHTLYFGAFTVTYSNMWHLASEVIAKSPWFSLLVPATFAVDSFFWLSGFLVGLNLVGRLLKDEQKAREGTVRPMRVKATFWVLYVVNRYYRLTPVFFFIVAGWWKVAPTWGRGPMFWTLRSMIKTTCDKYWWTTLTYVNNFVPDDLLDECFGWGWYLANDMQFYLVAPFLVVAYVKRRLVGLLSVLFVFIFCIIMNIYLTQHALTTGVVSKWTGQPDSPYTKPYVRIAPYLYGLTCAYLCNWLTPKLDTFRTDMEGNLGPKQERIRNILETRLYRYILWICAFGLLYGSALMCWRQIADQLTAGKAWSSGSVTFMMTITKVTWGLGLSIVMVLYMLGYGTVGRAFLSHDIWTPFARLTYCAYLVHPIIMQVSYASGLQAPYFSNWNYYLNFAGFATTAFLVATLMFLLVEKPMMNLLTFVMPKGL